MLRTLQLNNLQLDNSSKTITSKNYFNHYFTKYPIKILHCHSFTIYFKTTTSVKNYKNTLSYYFIIITPPRIFRYPLIYKTDSRLTTQPRNTFSLHKTYYTHNFATPFYLNTFIFLQFRRRSRLIKSP